MMTCRVLNLLATQKLILEQKVKQKDQALSAFERIAQLNKPD